MIAILNLFAMGGGFDTSMVLFIKGVTATTITIKGRIA